MNSQSLKFLSIGIACLILGGCYNNSHIRTQRVLEAEDKVVSIYGAMNLIGPETDWQSHDIAANGLPGLNFGLSYLQHRKGAEQGLNIAYGFGIGDYTEFTALGLGYDFRKVNIESSTPYRYGLHGQYNQIIEEYHYKTSSVVQLRPYLMTITSEKDGIYGGVHGLLSFGEIIRLQNYWDGDEDQAQFNYQASSLGAGLTLGYELRVGQLLAQAQADFSLIQQNHEVLPGYVNLVDREYSQVEPLDQSGLFISFGIAVSNAPKSVKKSRRNSSWMALPVEPPPIEAVPQFDPLTGELVVQEKPASIPRFDPLTGATISSEPVIFDPLTGEIIESTTPQSFLTASERLALITKPLMISSVNEIKRMATITDVQSNGLHISYNSGGRAVGEVIDYANIKTIKLSGGRKGMLKGLGAAGKTCATCVIIPVGGAFLLGDFDLLFMGLTIAPAASLGALVVTSMTEDTYHIHFGRAPHWRTDTIYKKRIITELTKTYLASGFPRSD